MRQTPSRALTWMQQAPLNSARTLLRGMRQRIYVQQQRFGNRTWHCFHMPGSLGTCPTYVAGGVRGLVVRVGLRFGDALMHQTLRACHTALWATAQDWAKAGVVQMHHKPLHRSDCHRRLFLVPCRWGCPRPSWLWSWSRAAGSSSYQKGRSS